MRLTHREAELPGSGGRRATNKLFYADNLDVLAGNQSSKERLGYPTQKPEALLESIIRALSVLTRATGPSKPT